MVVRKETFLKKALDVGQLMILNKLEKKIDSVINEDNASFVLEAKGRISINADPFPEENVREVLKLIYESVGWRIKFEESRDENIHSKIIIT
ncbi:MAG TPA: hypothetical protein QGH92_02855 [Candidatus Parcubacteria bacterium]|jgi:hypothetical protein|nr:hypothetical protein [Candidatus Parcubacteria bacterium]